MPPMRPIVLQRKGEVHIRESSQDTKRWERGWEGSPDYRLPTCIQPDLEISGLRGLARVSKKVSRHRSALV
jgi:hypothetical protein